MPPNPLLHNPPLLQEMIESFFDLCKIENRPPVPAAMALYIGFDTVGGFCSIAKNDPPDDTIPEDTVSLLRRAYTQIEAYYTEMGLKDAFPASFTKFMLSAYMDVSEKQIQRQENDTTIHITWAGETPLQIQQDSALPAIEAEVISSTPSFDDILL